MRILRKLFMLSLVSLLVFPVFSQEEEKDTGFNFNMQLELGAETFNDGDVPISYQKLSIYPDLSFGKVGIGLAITFHYRFDDGDGNFDFRGDDWVPHDDLTFWDIYLPIFRYVRYGHKGDPLYAKIGSIEDGTLGNGFIMSSYSNTNFLPERRIVGLAFDIDGSLFNFPYLGIETFTGNLAKFDVFGTRVYVRPLIGMDIPIIKNLQIGTTFAVDNNPNALQTFVDPDAKPNSVTMFDFDFRQPVLSKDLFSLAVFGDLAFQPASGAKDTSTGGLLGVGGKVVGFINYGLNALFLGENYVPFYFDSVYDLYRETKYEMYNGDISIPAYTGWLATIGFSFLSDKLMFSTSLDGAFNRQEGIESTYPHLKATFTVGEGIIPGVFFDASYDKRYINTFNDLISPEDAVIGANINYKAGPAIITLGYDLRYVANPDPGDDHWETTARLSTAISLF